MYINPYESRIGKVYSYEKLKLAYEKFLITNPEDRQYEFKTDKVELVFITGKSKAEKDLEPLMHPMYINTSVGDTEMIIVDVRPFVNPSKQEQFKKLEDIVKDETNYGLTILRTMLLVNNIENMDKVKELSPYIIVGFSKWISTMIRSSFMLDFNAAINIEVVCLHYYLCKINDVEQDASSFNMYKNRISRAGINYLKIDLINNILKDINIDPKNIEDLIENIKTVVTSDSITNLDVSSLANVIDRSWFGYNSVDMLIMSLEDPNTFIPIMYEAINNNSHKKSLLSKILKDNSRYIKSREFTKKLDIMKKAFIP